jgi:endonuclease/exonuclease/phosphatase (EEP) superfamily protein YafD
MTGKSITQLLAAAIFLVTVLSSTPLVLGLLGRVHPAFDSFAHFRAHLAVIVALGGVMLLATEFWKPGMAALLLGLAALWTTLSAYPLGLTRSAAADDANDAVYRLLQLNLRFDNRSPQRVLSMIGEVKPDIITLEEVSGEWRPWVERLSGMYPYSLICTGPIRIGSVAVLSRRPFAAPPARRCLDRGSLGMIDVDFGGRVVTVAALHLGWPWPADQWRQLARLEPFLAELGPTALLAGDLNAVTWSAAVRRVEASGALRLVPGIGPTWLDRRLPDVLRGLIGLPIDQVMTKGDISVVSVRTLPAVGSDHLPVLAEFRLTGRAAPEKPGETATVLLRP